MSKYKIKVIQHLLKGNQIAKSGDIVDGSKFISLQESIDGGYCEKVSSEDDGSNDDDGELDLDRMSRNKLLDFAGANGIELKSNDLANKQTIKDAILKHLQDSGE